MERSCVECEKEYEEKELFVCSNCKESNKEERGRGREGGGRGGEGSEGIFCKECFDITHKPRAFQNHISIPFSSYSPPSPLSSSHLSPHSLSHSSPSIYSSTSRATSSSNSSFFSSGALRISSSLTNISSSKKKEEFCLQHKGKEIELFCVECDEVLCFICSKMIKHKQHSSSLYVLEEYFSVILFPHLQILQKNVNNLYGDVNEKLLYLKEKREKLSAEIEKEQTKIDHFYDIFIDFLRLQKRFDRQLLSDQNENIFGSVEEIDQSIDRLYSFSGNLSSLLSISSSLLSFLSDQINNQNNDQNNNYNEKNDREDDQDDDRPINQLKRSNDQIIIKIDQKNDFSISKIIKTKNEIEKTEKEIKKMIFSIDQTNENKIKNIEMIRSLFMIPLIDISSIKQTMIDLLPDQQKQMEIDKQFFDDQIRDQKWIEKIEKQKEEIDQLNKSIEDEKEKNLLLNFQLTEQKTIGDQLLQTIFQLNNEICKLKCPRCLGRGFFHVFYFYFYLFILILILFVNFIYLFIYLFIDLF